MLESGFAGNLGFVVAQQTDSRSDALWFGESQSRVVVSVEKQSQAAFEKYLQDAGVHFTALGKVMGSAVVINGENWGELCNWKMGYDDSIGENMH